MPMRLYGLSRNVLALSLVASSSHTLSARTSCSAFVFSRTNTRSSFATIGFRHSKAFDSSPTEYRMTPPLIDVDCNLWSADLKTLQSNEVDDGDVWNILNEDAIKEANIAAMLSPSSTILEAKMGLARLQSSPPPLPIMTTVGVHPYHVNDDELTGKSLEIHGQEIRDLLQSNSEFCAAVGECGLDAEDGFPPLEDQLPWFQLQVKIAEDMKLPLFVHERLAFEETMKILKDVTVPIIIHCFTGTKNQCQEYIKRGYYISVSGYILKSMDNSDQVCECLQEGIIPLDKLMIETDAPYMGFTDCRDLYMQRNAEYAASLNAKKRKRLQTSIYPNVPSSLPKVLDKVVECYQQYDSTLTREHIAECTTRNADAFFGFGIAKSQ